MVMSEIFQPDCGVADGGSGTDNTGDITGQLLGRRHDRIAGRRAEMSIGRTVRR